TRHSSHKPWSKQRGAVYFPDEVSGLPELAKTIKSRDGRLQCDISVWIECSPGLRQRHATVRWRTAARLLAAIQEASVCDAECSAQLATKPAFPDQARPGGAGSAMAIPTIETEMKAAKLHSTSSTTNRNFKMSDSIRRQRDLQAAPDAGSP
uniref:VASt domain-containing protein n=1 Tax=Macrostomum lignano TaxID=282301 RepID=A0A1I8FKM5_9PLAT